MDTMLAYGRAQDGFDQVMAAIDGDSWDRPSTCEGWTIRDVVGHVIWGQRQLRAWATGEEYRAPTGFPGSTEPGALTGDDPIATWRGARKAADAALTDEALTRVVTLGEMGAMPVAGLVELLVTDFLAHSWDIGRPVGIDVRLDPDLIPDSYAWSRKFVTRRPELFGPEVEVADDADEQSRLLAFLGRDPRR